MNLLLHTNQLGIRGTEIAMYDYACGNENVLGNTSFICHYKNSPFNDSRVIAKFEDRFPGRVFSYDCKSEIDKIVESNDVDVFYALKAGVNDGVVSSKCKNVIHAVFSHYDPHGDVYAYISKVLGNRHSREFVPHIINPLPAPKFSFRDLYGIPHADLVFGRYGGEDTFDIDFVHETIEKVLNKRDDVWFVFMNTNKFIDHPRALFLESSSKLENKSAFVHGCDAMIHARRGGETFGLACAEFNMANKPVITWGGSHDNAHIHMLKDSALVYDTREGLEYIIESFPLSPKLFPKYPYNNWKQYDDYSEEIVMKEFERVFLS